jgi:hypothetical protein
LLSIWLRDLKVTLAEGSPGEKSQGVSTIADNIKTNQLKSTCYQIQPVLAQSNLALLEN